mgnify:CR=1 FL=1
MASCCQRWPHPVGGQHELVAGEIRGLADLEANACINAKYVDKSVLKKSVKVFCLALRETLLCMSCPQNVVADREELADDMEIQH